jgi:hypothetical protein
LTTRPDQAAWTNLTLFVSPTAANSAMPGIRRAIAEVPTCCRPGH